MSTPSHSQNRVQRWFGPVRRILSILAVAVLTLGVGPHTVRAEGTPPAPGTKITMQNWQQYKDFMPEGLTKLFSSQFFWKLPGDAEIDIGPTKNVPEPPTYLEASEKYGSQVQVVHMPNGHMDVHGYVAGQPFSDPQEPDKGYKILANTWYSYRPHLNIAVPSNPVRDCTVDRFANMACETISIAYRQEGYNTDPGVPVNESDSVWYTEWLMVEAPEQAKYTAQLTLFYRDNQKFQDEYVFVPTLRRSLRLSSSARCSPLLGSDLAQDDAQVTGFNGGIGVFDAKYLGHKKVIALTGAYNYYVVGHDFPKSFYQPVMFPPPSVGQWQVRDVDVLQIERVPSERAGYCYSKRIMYIDRYYHTGVWQDLYDTNGKLWKVALLAVPDAAKVPGVPGGVAPGLDGFFTMWDVQNDHATLITGLNEQGAGYFVNSDAPKEWQDYNRYATPSGLSLIMR